MTARAGRNQHETVGALLDRLVCELLVDDVMERDAAPGVHSLVQLLTRAKRRDDHRHLVLLADRKILIETVVGFVDDLVDRERRGQTIGMSLVVRGKFFLDPVQPFVEQRSRARVQCRKRADDSRLALGDHEIRSRHDEQRRPDRRNRKATLEQGRHRHRKILLPQNETRAGTRPQHSPRS